MEAYEQEFKLLQADIEEKLSDVQQNGDSRAAESCKRALNEADEVLAQIELALTNIPTAERGAAQSRARDYRQKLDGWKTSLQNELQVMDRKNLFGRRDQSAYGENDNDYDQRSHLLQGTSRLEQSSQRLLDSQRMAHETEGIGAGILRDLYGQRTQLEHSMGVLNETNSYLDRSLRTIKTMARRLAMNRTITTLIIALLIILILLALYNKFR
ncbi:SNARE Vti1 [Schizosaccharomyces japonicus yFS275]|uniref:SNARE Vti1 n=1 Tax=Schizosaccharomyces japonicus (strain yFS275 / FY16936) TaxID=402676 RepID=B6K5P8_SCHJY|nr:SNARE Vti1 [Schizosaccharomyces japonicus yFS275]EEB08852.1 SNARE Vti1 [Schizosaccharomyces japonicus yFS275]